MQIRALSLAVVVILVAVYLYGTDPREAPAAQAQDRPGPQFLRAAAFGVSPSVSSIALPPTNVRPKDGSKVPVREVLEPDEEKNESEDQATSHDRDGAIANFTPVPMPTPLLSFDGLSNYDNLDAYNAFIFPPDSDGDVGPSHYVQSANALIRIFDKNGNALTPPFKLSSLFATLNTLCSTRNDGDATVLYDPLADRWILSQYCVAFSPFRQMIAISKTGDPAGQYFVYEFVMPNVRINDYAKLSVWPDGYYMSTDEFYGSDYVGSGAFAFDRKRMLAGDPNAGYIYFHLPGAIPARVGGILSADLDGLNAPPAGSPNIFVGYSANEYGEPADAIRLFDFHADFNDPAGSSFNERPESPLPVAAFDPTSPPDRADVTQPPPGAQLDAVSDRMMYRIAYRNFGDHESLVFNQTVRMTPQNEAYRAGVRVYELRRNPAGPFYVSEQATLGDAGSSRWVGAAAEDNRGNLAVGYSAASDEKKPSILYSGKLAADPPGVFRAEGTLISGTGVQKAFGFRWGDYSGMTIDAEDDCTFWLTNEYYTQASEDFSDFTWLTRVGKFKFPECTPVEKTTISGTVRNAVTGQPIASALVSAASYSRVTDAAGTYINMVVVPGTYSLTISAEGYRSRTVTIFAGVGQSIVQNFSLDPVPVVQVSTLAIASESCGINHAVEPGEIVTINLSLRNTGRAAAANLTATLQRTGGILGPSASQNYGSLPADGSVATRQFSFTVSPNIGCGRDITLTFTFTGGTPSLEPITIPLRTGEVQYALRENFDSLTSPSLPQGWSASASGAEVPWVASAARSSSAPNSIFSPDPNQIGLNEIVSPPISITSPDARLSFRNWYDLETTFLRNRLYDGSVLEISIDGGAWADIIDAGGLFLTGGYDEGLIDGCCQNPLAGRHGWSGRSGVNLTPEFITSEVRLPASAAGRGVRFRWRVGTDIGTFREGQYLDDITVADGYRCSCSNISANRAPFDFDGDGKTDLAVFRPNDIPNAPDFVVQNSANGAISQTAWGSTGDIAANADFDGDGKTDLAVFRPAAGAWYILRSSDSAVSIIPFGLAADRPLPADYDGDGKADVGVFRPSTGIWYSLNSSNGQFAAHQFGLAEDLPVPGDYDGDGKADIAVFRPSTATWYIARSSDAGYTIVQFGLSGDKPVPGDFDGDGKTDLAVFRLATGIWYLLQSDLGFGAAQFGQAGDTPLHADFDGDGQTDIGVFRPSTAVWYYIRSSTQSIAIKNFGSPTDQAVPSIFVN